jgi:CheY-like chemotaxis protein
VTSPPPDEFMPGSAAAAATLGIVPAALLWVLVVDDDPDVRELWANALTDGGYQVLTASNGRDALALMRAVVPDFIVLDLCMPGMAGPEFLQVLQHSPALRRIPVLIVSAFLEDAGPLPVTGLRIVGRLAKPLRLSTLLGAVPAPPRR